MHRLILFFILFTLGTTAVVSQTSDSQKREMERYKEKLEEEKENFIQELVDSLEVDDFQKHIIKQKLYSYFDAKQELYEARLESYVLQEQLAELDRTHFADLKDICSEETIQKVQDAVQHPQEQIKKNKKNKRKRKKADN
ncbi:hypothetical protein [Mangrovimonas sp. DI 80]|uniref:hypothetical protein n=1 Tax=Mangrovimonas sp. DI 80 TaxID=1779330 RepID=UPI0009757090|nr:hypothetical protein [Mangrovimonas sp. DI 80]OMP30610.1 hypothetical protein BKM32_10210 [Mangrovimonas sp. DI 80]